MSFFSVFQEYKRDKKDMCDTNIINDKPAATDTEIQPLIVVNEYSVYQSEIDYLCDEYISMLPDPAQVTKSATFPGLLQHIYKTKLRFILEDDIQRRPDKRRRNNYTLLDNVFNNIYIPLCSLYGIIPTVIGFCAFIHIDYLNICDVRNGTYRDSGNAASPADTHIIQKWYEYCESALYSRAIADNSIGAIFALKARHNYNDNTQQQVNININRVEHNPDTIADLLRIAETNN